MQRVLSFQMGRGIGEPSEFVTKRMCFSFLVSVAFLTLLCGFLIGRFAAGRALELRAEKLQREFIGNGLEMNDNLREELIRELKENFDASPYVADLRNSKALESVEKSLSGLNIFKKVTGNDSCVVAIVNGSHEPDRYIALAASGDNIAIAIPVAREFQKIYKNHGWIPRRTLFFIMSSNSMDSCLLSVSQYERSKIIAYLMIDEKPIEGPGYFITAGSDVVQSTVAEATSGFTSIESPKETTILPRLKYKIPHTIFSFYSTKATNLTGRDDDDDDDDTSHESILAQVLATTIWRLSEMTIFQWNPALLDKVYKVMEQLKLSQHNVTAENIKVTIERINEHGKLLNEKINSIDRLQSLTVRMMNDFLIDLERALLCPDKNSQSKTDLAILQQLLKNQQNNDINDYLNDMLICYEDADKILQDIT